MKGKTKYVAFSTQKGGAGKTTITVLVASYLHYVKGYNVAVIDCDYPQHSILEMRDRDLKLAMEDQYYKGLAYEQFTRLNKKAYRKGVPLNNCNSLRNRAVAFFMMGRGNEKATVLCSAACVYVHNLK